MPRRLSSAVGICPEKVPSAPRESGIVSTAGLPIDSANTSSWRRVAFFENTLKSMRVLPASYFAPSERAFAGVPADVPTFWTSNAPLIAIANHRTNRQFRDASHAMVTIELGSDWKVRTTGALKAGETVRIA